MESNFAYNETYFFQKMKIVLQRDLNRQKFLIRFLSRKGSVD